MISRDRWETTGAEIKSLGLLLLWLYRAHLLVISRDRWETTDAEINSLGLLSLRLYRSCLLMVSRDRWGTMDACTKVPSTENPIL